jgi:hypothetical protein
VTMIASDTTQEIDYRSCDTIQMRIPKVSRWARFKQAGRRGWEFFVDRVVPPLVGCFIGLSLSIALWALILMWWFSA